MRWVYALLLLLLCTEQAHAITYRAAAHTDATTGTSCTVTKPTGTADNDIMFALIKLPAQEAATPPSGWSTGYLQDNTASGLRFYLFYKVASSEGASFQFTWTTSGRHGCTVVSYYGGFNTSSAVDNVSNVNYETSNTTLRAASFTVAAANSAILFFGFAHSSGAVSTSAPTNPGTFTEDLDFHDATGRFYRSAYSYTWSSSGSTGDIDATFGSAVAAKHAFAVSLNPAAAASVNFFPRRLQVN